MSADVIDVIIPAFNPDKDFEKLLSMLSCQHTAINKIIIINTVDEAFDRDYFEERYDRLCQNLEFHYIEKSEFNHGLTRNLGASFSKADFIVFMTQDAIPADKYLIDELIKPFENKDVYMTYARQLPKKNCKYLERYTRAYNYPGKSVLKSKEDIETMGIKALFCSDVCAAYRRDKFYELGKFIKTDFNEDTFFAYNVLMAGKKIYYAANARVFHSHNYTYIQQFKRNFLVGKSQKSQEKMFENIKSEDEGKKMVKSACSHIIRHKRYYMLPDLVLNSGFKYLGYKSGKIYGNICNKK